MWTGLNCFKVNSVIVKSHKNTSDLIGNNRNCFTSSSIYKIIIYINITFIAFFGVISYFPLGQKGVATATNSAPDMQ